MLERLSHRLDLAALHQPISPLACQYMRQVAPALSFYGHDAWSEAAVVAAANGVLAIDRSLLVATLVKQQEARGASQAAKHAARLAEPGAAVVVTGQAGRPFRGTALRPLQGTRHPHRGPSRGSGPGATGGSGLLGGVRRPRFCGDPFGEHSRFGLGAAHCPV